MGVHWAYADLQSKWGIHWVTLYEVSMWVHWVSCLMRGRIWVPLISDEGVLWGSSDMSAEECFGCPVI